MGADDYTLSPDIRAALDQALAQWRDDQTHTNQGRRVWRADETTAPPSDWAPWEW